MQGNVPIKYFLTNAQKYVQNKILFKFSLFFMHINLNKMCP